MTQEDDDEFEANLRAYQYPSKVDEWLFVGSYRQSQNRAVLAELGIQAVLCVKDSCRYPEDEGIEYAHVPLSDFGKQDLCSGANAIAPAADAAAAPAAGAAGAAGAVAARALAPLEECARFIASNAAAGRATLVHCSQGINRGPTVAIGVLMLWRGLTLAAAFAHVLRSWPCASPHERYFEQLQALDVRLRGGDVAPSLTREEAGPSLQQLMRECRVAAAAEEEEEEEEEVVVAAAGGAHGKLGAVVPAPAVGVAESGCEGIAGTPALTLALPILSLPCSSARAAVMDPLKLPMSPPPVPSSPVPSAAPL
jgi:protein-tyrosine phosphatase